MWTAGESARTGIFRSGSILLQPGVAVPVKAGVAEGDFGNAGALEQEPVFMLIGHADAAMHLDGLVGDQVKGRVAARLGMLEQINRLGWEERSHLAEILRKGESLRTVRKTRRHTEKCFHHSLDWARKQQAKSWELRTSTSFARLWQSQGKRKEAYDLLAPVYDWFAKGFGTKDLKEAKALLDELES